MSVKKTLTKGLAILFSLFSLLLVYLFYFHTVSFTDKRFQYSNLGTTLEGKAFTGMSYQLHGNKQLYKIQFFINGKQVETEHRWYSNGVKWQEAQYKDGNLHGTLKVWYRDGKVRMLRSYIDGEAHGEFWGWHPNGVVSEYHKFEMGKQIIYKSFISDGKPFYNYVFRDNKTVGLKAGDFCKTKKL